MKDRVPKYPGRVYVTPENVGAPYYATIERADEPVEAGTPLNKATLLSDDVANLISLSGDQATVSEALKAVFNLANPYASTSRYGRTILTSIISDAENLAATPKAVKDVSNAVSNIIAKKMLISQTITADNTRSAVLNFSGIDLSKYVELVIRITKPYSPNEMCLFVDLPPSWEGASSGARNTMRMDAETIELKKSSYSGGDDVYLYNDYAESRRDIGAFVNELHIVLTDDTIRNSESEYWSYGFYNYIYGSGYSGFLLCNLLDGWDGSKITLYCTDGYGNPRLNTAHIDVYGIQGGN